jgi:hypothetical protein
MSLVVLQRTSCITAGKISVSVLDSSSGAEAVELQMIVVE